MVYNAFDQTGYLDIPFNKYDEGVSNVSKASGLNQKRTFKNVASKALLAFVTLSLFGNFLYDRLRPTVLGQVRGGSFTNNGVSELYLENVSTKSIDTLLLNTKQNASFIFFGSPDNFNGRANYLEEALKPGSFVEVSLHKNNRVYEIKSITSPKKEGLLKDLEVLADL